MSTRFPQTPVPIRFHATHFRTNLGVTSEPTGCPGEYVSRVELWQYNAFWAPKSMLCSFSRYGQDGQWYIGNEAWLPEGFPVSTALFFGQKVDFTDLPALKIRMGQALDAYWRVRRTEDTYRLREKVERAMRDIFAVEYTSA